MDDAVLATIAANIEKEFPAHTPNDLNQKDAGEVYSFSFTVEGHAGEYNCELEILDVMEFNNGNGEYVKAVAFRDESGNIYVHYNGTGDGNWGYNDVAFGGGPSDVQQKSLEFFDQVVNKFYGELGGNIYVTGHSQGGNNAQYVTMNTQYGLYIDQCIAMDAPGFSHEAVQRMKDQYGEAYYENQRNKIYSYNGESDYVDPLGLEIIAPQDKDHLRIIDCPDGAGPMEWHLIDGMMDGTSLRPRVDYYTPVHYLVVALNNKIAASETMTPEEKAQLATQAMKLAEMLVGNEYEIYGELTAKDLEGLLNSLLPLLCEVAAEDPEMFRSALEMFGLSPDVIALLETFVGELGKLTDGQRESIIKGLSECITFKQGEPGFTDDIKAALGVLFLTLPSLLNTAVKNPSEVFSILEEVGVFDALKNAIKDNPFAASLIILAVIKFRTIIAGVTVAILAIPYLYDLISKCIEQIESWSKSLKEFFINTIEAIKKTIAKIKDYLNSLTPGAKYVSNNPEFRADTEAMRNYANRLSSVNKRLKNLDKDLDSLYWQVGLLDILDILRANIIIGYSPRIGLCQTYLNSSADALDDAERKVLGYMGG